MVLTRSLSERKSFKVSGTLLSILADLNAVAWMVSDCPFISKSASYFINLLEIVPISPFTIGVLLFYS